jgi:GH15 family glucan-1,4-alpha-glucosidase
LTYKPIIDYGVIGDMRSAALVARDGSIDWLCFPRFDSPSIFASILDHDKGGHFSLHPAGHHTSTQHYVDDTNILRTDFQNGAGSLSLTDFMPISGADGGARAVRLRWTSISPRSSIMAAVRLKSFKMGAQRMCEPPINLCR